MANNKLGNNIKNLRKSFGETQLELALAIGVDSPNTIGNYEKGKRFPQPDIRKKIAAHYRITEDELVNSTFSGKRVKSIIFDDPEKLSEMTLVMLPIVESKTALTNEKFKTGYEAHLRAYDAMKNKSSFSDEDFDLCIDSVNGKPCIYHES